MVTSFGNIYDIYDDYPFLIKLPYYLGDPVKTYDTGRFIFRGKVSGYTIIDDGLIIHVTEPRTGKSYGFLPNEICFDIDNYIKEEMDGN